MLTFPGIQIQLCTVYNLLELGFGISSTNLGKKEWEVRYGERKNERTKD